MKLTVYYCLNQHSPVSFGSILDVSDGKRSRMSPTASPPNIFPTLFMLAACMTQTHNFEVDTTVLYFQLLHNNHGQNDVGVVKVMLS